MRRGVCHFQGLVASLTRCAACVTPRQMVSSFPFTQCPRSLPKMSSHPPPGKGAGRRENQLQGPSASPRFFERTCQRDLAKETYLKDEEEAAFRNGLPGRGKRKKKNKKRRRNDKIGKTVERKEELKTRPRGFHMKMRVIKSHAMHLIRAALVGLVLLSRTYRAWHGPAERESCNVACACRNENHHRRPWDP